MSISKFPIGPELAAPFNPVESQHIFSMDGWNVWCSSIVRDLRNGKFHLFFCRWPEETGHDGWVQYSEICRAESATLEGRFDFKAAVIGSRAGRFWDSDNAHNVIVREFGSRYYMYYTGNFGEGDYWSHRNNQRIGVAVADDPRGPWTRSDTPLLEPRKGKWDGLMHSNPAVASLGDGKFLLMFKAVAEGPAPRGGKVRHGVAFGERPEGPFIIHDKPIFDLPGIDFPYEDPGLWEENGVLYCLVKTMHEQVSPSGKMGILLFRSSDGINWAPADPPIVLEREVKLAGGATVTFERLERPQVYLVGENRRVLLVAAQPMAEGSRQSACHQVGPANMPSETPVAYNIRLFWNREIW